MNRIVPLVFLMTFGCGGDEPKNTIKRTKPKVDVIALAATAPIKDLVISEASGKQYLGLLRTGKIHQIGTGKYDGLVCMQDDPKADLCSARTGDKCGLVHRRTGKVLEPLTHTCKPNTIRRWSPCKGQCIAFSDGARFQYLDGVFKKAKPEAEQKKVDRKSYREKECADKNEKSIPPDQFRKAMKAKDWALYFDLVMQEFTFEWCKPGGDLVQNVIFERVNKVAQRGGLNKLKVPLKVDRKLRGKMYAKKYVSGCRVAYIGALGANIYCKMKVNVKKAGHDTIVECDRPAHKADPKAVYMEPVWYLEKTKTGRHESAIGVLSCLATKSKGLVLKPR